MPAKNFIISNKANKQVEKLPLFIQKKIEKAFEKIQSNPISGIRLRGEFKNYYKYRLGDYRIVYSFEIKNSTVSVLKIEHRQGVYK